MSAMLEAALSYAARGWPVFPCWPGRKNPVTEHGFKDATTDETQIRAWWTARPGANVAIATGPRSFDVLDIDVEPGGNGYAALAHLQAAGLLDGHGPMVRTRSGGLHIYFAGTTQRSSDARDHSPVDFKADGGYVLAPPSWVETDDKGPAGRYELIARDPGDGTVLDWRIVCDLLIPPPPFQQPAAEKAALATSHDRPGDDYAAKTDWADILTPHGWRQVRQIGAVRYWCRPDKTGRGVSASTRDDGGLWVFSTATTFKPEQLYSKFGAYAVLHGFGEDYTAAAAQLRRDGLGAQPPAITLTSFQQPPDSQQDAEQPPHSSWHPRDLTAILAGDASGDPPPAFLRRADGQMLLYRGKINALIGESESGKTWVALVAVAQALKDGQQVVYLDFEDAPAGITARLRSLGATNDQLAKQFRYIAPDEPLTPLAVADIGAVLADPVPDLIVVDGVNAAMTLLGLNLKDNKDATDFSQRVLRPLKRTGAAVLTVDHVTKSAEGRGLNAIGAQAKRADIDGAAFIVEAVRKFGRGQQGKLRLTVSKDRPGHVRAASAGATRAGTVILTSDDDGAITYVIEAPDTRAPEEREPWRPTIFMEKVSRLLESCDGESKRGIRVAIKGSNDHIDIAIDRLADEGYISRPPGQKIRSVKPYREISEHQIADRADRADSVPERAGRHGESGPGETVPTVPCVRDVVTTRHGGTARPNGQPEQDQKQGTVPDVRCCTDCGEDHDPADSCFSTAQATR